MIYADHYTRKGIIYPSIAFLYPIRYSMSVTDELIDFVKTRREQLGLTQQELADRAGVGLRFVRDLEQGKESLRLDKVNQVLALFGHKMGPIKVEDRDEL
jgi:y4mF family transcriptional regulator